MPTGKGSKSAKITLEIPQISSPGQIPNDRAATRQTRFPDTWTELDKNHIEKLQKDFRCENWSVSKKEDIMRERED